MGKFKDKISSLPWGEIIAVLKEAWDVAPDVWAAFKKQGERLPWRKETIKVIEAQNKEIVYLKAAIVSQNDRITALEDKLKSYESLKTEK